ncbi:unnamed protein product [Lupinus luteus]|uniref:Secreted protein n=1 Tax=Lupinus luteus TaxID=3873 RepID=A0AAV1XJR5_LUPLU
MIRDLAVLVTLSASCGATEGASSPLVMVAPAMVTTGCDSFLAMKAFCSLSLSLFLLRDSLIDAHDHILVG